MENIVDIVIKIVATLLAFGIGYVGKLLVQWLKTKLDENTFAKLDTFIAELVAAAEQLYKADDTTGDIRLGYVQKMLVEAGYEVTSAVMAMIESKVFSINLVNKTVGENDEPV